tara:strand:+ start:403 stop:627 length:225 start_codon:yes stop_codon:yes gene_type:complete
MSHFYCATGEMIEKKQIVKNDVKEVKENIEYKANGNLVIEKDENEVVTHAIKLPTQQVYNSENLGLSRRYLEEE